MQRNLGENNKEEDLTYLSAVFFTYFPSQASLMEMQMWQRSSCSALSGVIKKRLGHIERPRRPSRVQRIQHASESGKIQQSASAGFLQLVTVRL